MTLTRECICPVVVTRGADQARPPGLPAAVRASGPRVGPEGGIPPSGGLSLKPHTQTHTHTHTQTHTYSCAHTRPPPPNPPPHTPISTRYESRLDPGNVRNYGRLVAELAASVPDGLVVFFVSYSYMDYVISRWGV
jgi:hypothetical protein